MSTNLGSVIGSASTALLDVRRATLPFLPPLARDSQTVVHLVNPLVNAYGGSENRTIELSKAIGQHAETRIWSDRRVDSRIHQRIQHYSIKPPFTFPCGGNLVFVGVYFKIGRWARFAKPRRVIAVYNTPGIEDLKRFQSEMAQYGLGKRVEFVYASEWLREQAGVPGEVHPSIIDLARFRPTPKREQHGPFVVGRLSRDVPEKHHPDDPSLWIELARRGFHVRLMGATCLSDALRGHSCIEVLPVGTESAESFLQSLDAFVYRTDSRRFIEPSGRVVLEALSCGLPVVCDRVGGYRETIIEGGTGLFADDNAEIISRLEVLRTNRDLHEKLSNQGREYVEKLFSEASMSSMTRFFVD